MSSELTANPFLREEKLVCCLRGVTIVRSQTTHSWFLEILPTELARTNSESMPTVESMPNRTCKEKRP